MHYYYPLSTKDFTFENIFSTESVSPPFFYPVRDFGIGYFSIIPNLNHNNAIILYNQPPYFEVENNAKFILEISENSLDTGSLIVISEGVFAYQNTIYLNKDNFKIYFFSEKDKRVSMLKAEISLPTKCLDKYASNFHVISESICKNYNFNALELILNPYQSKFYITGDKCFNKFKGLVYGLVIGIYNRPAKEEILFKRLIKEIINSFAELKSHLADSRFLEVKETYNKERFNNFERIKRIFDLINFAEKSYFDLIKDVDLDEDSLAEILFENTNNLKSLESSRQYINYALIDDEIFGTTKFKELKNFCSKFNDVSGKTPIFKSLRSQMELFIDQSSFKNKIKVNLSEINNNIKMSLYEIEKSISKDLGYRDTNETFNLDDLKYNFEKNEMKISGNFQNLNTEELRDMESIINVILQYSERDEIISKKDAILQIVKHVGDLFSKGSKETLLYQYLNNDIDTYAFEKISNAVMKNFVSFIFNSESIEKLENFINIKNVEKEWMAYAFWGSFNGFANLSGNFTKSIFSHGNDSIQKYIDTYLQKYIDVLKLEEVSESENNQLDKMENETNYNSDSNQINSFYQKFVIEKYNLSKEEFESILFIKEQELFCSTVKLKFKINKKDAIKLFNIIRKDLDSPLLFC